MGELGARRLHRLYQIGFFLTLLAERHHFQLPVAESVKRFVGFAAGACFESLDGVRYQKASVCRILVVISEKCHFFD